MQNNDIMTVLSREGVLLNVSISFWRAHKKLQAADLGLDASDITNRLISLGHKKLLPKEALAGFSLIESRAHALVESATFPFLGGIGRFLPNAKLPEVTDKLSGLEREFGSELERFKARYDSLREEARREWHRAATKLMPDPEVILANIESAYPRPDGLDRFFGFRTHLFQVTVPEGADQLELMQAADQCAIIEARNRAASEASEQIRSGTRQFVQECVATLREQTAKLCGEMLASMSGGKTSGVHQKTLNRLVKFIDEFKSLNFAGDEEMEAMLERARRELLSRTAEGYRDDSSAQVKLREGLTQLRDQAREMAHQDATDIVERFGQLGRRRFSLAA
jgi:hypothetical protein